MWRKRIAMAVIAGLLGIVSILGAPAIASAETKNFSWEAPTAYTDGSPIGTAAITYTAFWSASASLSGPHSLLENSPATTVAFDPDLQGMVRGSTIYFAVYATVNAANSANATTNWNDPFKTPNAPGNPRITWLLYVIPWVVPG